MITLKKDGGISNAKATKWDGECRVNTLACVNALWSAVKVLLEEEQ